MSEQLNQTEEVKVAVENQSANETTITETEVSVDRSVEQTPPDKTDAAGANVKDENVNVSINQTINTPESAPAHNPHKNYEAAQPVVDPIG